MILDLQPAIDGLRMLKSDLEAYYWDQPMHGSRREQIGYCIRQLSDRAGALESIVFAKGTVRVRVGDLAAEESRALAAATAMLDMWMTEGEPFERTLQIVADALASADRIGLRAAGGTPDLGLALVLRT